ncbi:divergent polysaccharide deacetylase family protein [uncultured Shimia sp.]|uniref:divergent polysaccharide deacetylase family protein n=1 Tax=uncultured Shimia sp. TaxID=573152 RepID=UPI00261E0115|nr:divergent polysaccharide deacetylase family protein [uncultured Shimia sp.]
MKQHFVAWMTRMEHNKGAMQMLRGVLSGVFWGGIVVVIVVGFASLLAPLPATVDPQQSAVEPTTGSSTEGSGDIGATSEADGTLEDGVSPPKVETETEDEMPLADTESAPQPQPETPDMAMSAPDPGVNGGEVSTIGTETPVMTSPEAPTPDAPEAPELTPDSITSNPAQPSVPDVGEGGAFAPAADTETETEMAPEPTAEPSATPEADVSPGAESGDQPATGESLLKPATSLTEKTSELESSRLPTVGADSTEAGTDVVARPFDSNAVQFEAAGDKPLMSIVLIDDGAPQIPPEALADFPYPLSIAINTLVPDVAERVATYRDMGFEILAMVDLPAAAAPADVEVALTAHLSVMPEAVAVMEGTGDGLQGSKPLSDQVAAVLLGSGHGLLLFQQGLDTARKLASREGVPAATVFRDFDSKGQTASVMRRFLDQAAFKANQEGGVIMVGRLKEETLSALLVWGLQDRAGTVAVAPVSATIRAKQN